MENVDKEKAIQEYVKAVAEFEIEKQINIAEFRLNFCSMIIKSPLFALWYWGSGKYEEHLYAIRTSIFPPPPTFFEKGGVVKNVKCWEK